jgi:hypothetical protein
MFLRILFIIAITVFTLGAQSLPAHDHNHEHEHRKYDSPKALRKWKAYGKKHKISLKQQKAMLAVAPRLSYKLFERLKPKMQRKLIGYAERQMKSPGSLSMCWQPGVSADVATAFHAVEEAAREAPVALATQFVDTQRWATTATNGSGQNVQGRPITLTWSFIPDGTSIPGSSGEPVSPSNLIAFLDARYGVTTSSTDLTLRPWFSVFQAMFNNISLRTGLSYVYEPNDDAATFAQSSVGILNVRGDIRICGHFIDGETGSNTLAYNFFPNFGDMVIDTSNVVFFGNTSSSSRRLRNVLEHEHGHGLALNHVCPINNTKLMEPLINTSFVGLQLDDVHSLNRLYGDFYEKHNAARNNDTATNAAVLPITVGLALSADPNFPDRFLSIDDNSDIDFFRITAPVNNMTLTFRVTPAVGNFLQGPQDMACDTGTLFDFQTRQNLDIAVLAANGTTVIAEANSQPIGGTEEIVTLNLPSSGNYFLRVTGGTLNESQLYKMNVLLSSPTFPPIAEPNNLVANRAVSSQVTLTWADQSNNETSFRIEKRQEADGAWQLLGTVPANTVTYTDTSPTVGTNLFYRVFAVNADTSSISSNIDNLMVVDLTAGSYVYDFGTSTSPVEAGAFRVSEVTDGDVSWSGVVTPRDRGSSDLANRDFVFASAAVTWEHRIANGVWEITVRHGDSNSSHDQIGVSLEGVTVATGISPGLGQFLENTYTVSVNDGSLAVGFFDGGGTDVNWVVNRIRLKRLGPYESYAFLKNLPPSLAARTDDADSDGLPNIQEYFFGTNPLLYNTNKLTKTQAGINDSVADFIFQRDPTAVVGSITYQLSSDLQTWLPYNPDPSLFSVTPSGSLEEVTLRYPASANSGFIRISIKDP